MSKPRRVRYNASVKDAYATEIRRLQERISGLMAKLDEAVGEGRLPNNLDWRDVSMVSHINQLLDAAISVPIPEA